MPQRPLPDEWVANFAATLERVHRERPELPIAWSGNKTSVLSLTVKITSEAENLSAATVRSRWQIMVARGLAPKFMTEPAPQIAPDVPPAPARTLDEELTTLRLRSERDGLKRQVAESRSRILELEDRLAEQGRLAEMNPHPAEWTLAAKSGRKSEHMPYLLTSDHQVGEVVRAEETDAGYGYDVAIYRRRYRALIDSTIHLCLDHSAEWRFPGIIYARGGDTISGAIHDELAETDEVTPIEAVSVAFEEEAAGIAKLLEVFGRVDVKDIGGGNHDRDTVKPRAKRASGHSYDSLVGVWLRREFRDRPQVTFQGTQSPDVRFPIYDSTILLTHGDKIGSRGGQGFIGPAATIMRGAQKVLDEQARLGFRVNEIHMGHHHTFLDAGWAVCNGSLPGYNEYAKTFRARPEPPMQLLMFYHPTHGRVATRRIVLEEPRKAA